MKYFITEEILLQKVLNSLYSTNVWGWDFEELDKIKEELHKLNSILCFLIEATYDIEAKINSRITMQENNNGDEP